MHVLLVETLDFQVNIINMLGLAGGASPQAAVAGSVPSGLIAQQIWASGAICIKEQDWTVTILDLNNAMHMACNLNTNCQIKDDMLQ